MTKNRAFQCDKANQSRTWQFSLRTFTAAVMGIAICLSFIVQWVIQYPCRANPSSMYDAAVEAYQSESYFDALSKCDRYLDNWPAGSKANEARELRKRIRFTLANKPSK
ncbi:MAG: hypothetical protein H6822_05000 [Planctomycetaceae bacterium]|nr:hypothetical protein [Planctomycetaceae bacterium]